MAKIKYVSPKDAADLSAIQNRAVKSVNKARDMVQIALVATAIHAGLHNDYSSANGFVQALGNTVNGRAVVDWLVQFVGLKVSEDGKSFDAWSGPEYIKENLKKAKDTMWWNLKVANPFKGYSLEAALQALIKRHESVVAKASEDAEAAKLVNVEVNDATIRQVLALCHFDAIIADAGNTDKLEGELPADAAQVA